MTIPDEMQGSGYGRELMADLVDTGRLIGIDRINLRAEQIGRYAWVKMGFRPTDDAWREPGDISCPPVPPKELEAFFAGAPNEAHSN
jgi:GNAT superfamily N-acetyltransferase